MLDYMFLIKICIHWISYCEGVPVTLRESLLLCGSPCYCEGAHVCRLWVPLRFQQTTLSLHLTSTFHWQCPSQSN